MAVLQAIPFFTTYNSIRWVVRQIITNVDCFSVAFKEIEFFSFVLDSNAIYT